MKTTDYPGAPGSKPGSEANAKEDLKSLPMPELLAKLGSSRDGLRQAEAEERLARFGPNEIEEKKINPYQSVDKPGLISTDRDVIITNRHSSI